MMPSDKLKFRGKRYLQGRLSLRDRGEKPLGFATLTVFRDVRDVREYARGLDAQLGIGRPNGYWERCEAFATHWTPLRRQEKRLGAVVFHEGRLGVGIVAHEMAHLALYHVTRGRKGFPVKLTKKQDEELAWQVGELVAQFWRWYWRHV